MTDDALMQVIHDVNATQARALEVTLSQSMHSLDDLLRLDEYHRHGHEETHLQQAMGPIATSALNLSTLSKVLDAGIRDRSMPPERLQRVERLQREVRQLCTQSADLKARVESLDGPVEQLLANAESHMEGMAGLFRCLRTAHLETHSKYQPHRHDAMFARFSWRALSPAELCLCPPFVAVVAMDAGPRGQLRSILTLLESGLPIKVLALRSQPGRGGAIAGARPPSTLSLEMLPLSLRGVDFIQTHAAQPEFAAQLAALLGSPHPGLASLLVPRDGEPASAFQERATRAVGARAFPLIRYDPDSASGFVARIDVSANPDPDADWGQDPDRAALDESAGNHESDEPFTFAHFACGQPEFTAEFTDPDPSQPPGEQVPLHRYLALNHRQRVGKQPCVRITGEDGQPVVRIASPAIVEQTADQLHLWQTLQELAGIANPHVAASARAVEQELQARHRGEMEQLRQRMEAAFAGRESAAVEQAVRRIVQHLTGVDVGPLTRAAAPQAKPDQS